MLDRLNWLSNIVVHTAPSTWCHLGILHVGGSSSGSKSTFNCKFPNDHQLMLVNNNNDREILCYIDQIKIVFNSLDDYFYFEIRNGLISF